MKTWIKITIGLMLAIIIAGLLTYKYVYNKPHTDYLHAVPVYTLNAGTVYRSFQTNTKPATRIFVGKMIGLTGPVSKVEKADTLVTIVFVFNQGMFGDEGIRCSMLPASRKQALGLNPGSVIAIKGYCSGYNETDVIFEHCSIVSN